jgi:hypothetical protein
MKRPSRHATAFLSPVSKPDLVALNAYQPGCACGYPYCAGGGALHATYARWYWS